MFSTAHPLEIPEIVAKVGHYVRLWDYNPYDPWTEPDFIPNEILSYTLVSKTWRASLLPICWEIYDGKVMSHIPNDVISKYSYHFTSFINCKHRGPFHCINLRLFETQDDNVGSYNLIKEFQSSISAFNWVTDDHWNARGILDLSDKSEGDSLTLATIGTSITHLELRNWIVSDVPEVLLKFLTRYDCLSSISLNNLLGIHHFPYSESTMANTSSLQPYLVLPTISTIHLDCIYQASKSIIEFITCCPNLTRLEIEGSWMYFKDAYIGTPFYLYCPNLKSFAINLPEVDPNSGRYILFESDLAELIVSLTGPPGTGKLDTFEAKLVDFGEATSKALVKLAKDTLEVFRLELGERGDFELEEKQDSCKNINYILTNCHKLKKISLKCDTGCDFAGCFEGLLACLDTLEELCIYDGLLEASYEKIEDAEVDYGDEGTWIWHTEDKMALELWNNIFVHVKHMPHLRGLSINDRRFYKIKKTNYFQ